jgi:flagellar basal-body rod protein FlgB
LNPVYLFDLAARHTRWAEARQATITGNIANANTPGYDALDVEPFADVMDQTRLTMARTDGAHLGGVDSATGGDAVKVAPSESWDITNSGNSVSIEQELVKADDVSQSFSLDVSVVRAFHRMLLTSVRTSS